MEKLEAHKEPKDDKIPVCWTRSGGGPPRKQRHEVFVRSKRTYSRETSPSDKLVVEEGQGEKVCSLDITTTNGLEGKQTKGQVFFMLLFPKVCE